jgi:Beta-galactosidase
MLKEKWYQKSYRRNLVDMHIEEWHEEFLARFDPEAYFENLKRAHIKSPMLYIQSHVGYCNWPTKSGHMHNAFRGREQAMRDLFDLCHAEGMDVVAYYSLIFNNWAHDTYPEWRMLDSGRNGSRKNGNRYGLCCPNNKGYRSFILKQINEFCHYFNFEGVFFDMTFWPMVCYCDSCKARWEQEAGGEMPRFVDWNDDRWLLFQKKRQEWMGEFADFASTAVKKIKPECSVVHNCSSTNRGWQVGTDERIYKANDYSSGDISGGQSFACKFFYNTSLNQPFEYMTTRCFPSLGEHTTTKSFETLYKSVMLSYAHHGAAFLIDAIDPRGTLDQRVYERIGEVLSKAEKYETYLEGELAQDVGVYYNISLKADMDLNAFPIGSDLEGTDHQPHLDAAVGASNILQEHHIPFGVVNSWRLELLDKLRVLILPDVPFMSKNEVNAVRNFVINGGGLYISSHSAPDLVEEIFGVKYEGITDESITYMSPTDKGIDLMPDFTRDYPMTLTTKQVILSSSGRGEVLATMTLPYTLQPEYQKGIYIIGDDRGSEDYIDDPSYRFASIHSNPPGRFTNSPSILRTSFGKGKVIWSAAPFEAANREQHSSIFTAIVRELGESFSFSSDAPDFLELIMFKVPEKRRLLISIVDVLDRFKIIETGNFEVHIKVEAKPLRVMLLPFEEDTPFIYQEGEVVIKIDKLEIFKMFAIDY